MNKYTAPAPTVALHIPLDRVDVYDALGAFANDHGVALGTVNSNTFQDDDYKFGSLTHSDPKIRKKAIVRALSCASKPIELARIRPRLSPIVTKPVTARTPRSRASACRRTRGSQSPREGRSSRHRSRRRGRGKRSRPPLGMKATVGNGPMSAAGYGG